MQEIRCPKCGCSQLNYKRKGFGIVKSLAGGAIFGGVGLLFGFAGSKRLRFTCMNCGHTWFA